MTKFLGAAVFLAGDKNELPLPSLLLGLPNFVQSVAHPTHKDKIIDVIVTNCGQYYTVPEVTSTILLDNPRHAAPSDHMVLVARPVARSACPQSNSYSKAILICTLAMISQAQSVSNTVLYTGLIRPPSQKSQKA